MELMGINKITGEREKFRATMTQEMMNLKSRMSVVSKDSRIFLDKGNLYRAPTSINRTSKTPSKDRCCSSCGFCKMETLPVLQLLWLLVCISMVMYFGIRQF